MLPAYLIGQHSQLLPHTAADLPLIIQGLKCQSVYHVGIIENAVDVDMLTVVVNGKEVLVLVFQELFA